MLRLKEVPLKLGIHVAFERMYKFKALKVKFSPSIYLTTFMCENILYLRKANERARSYIYIVRLVYRCESPLCLIIHRPADIPYRSFIFPENCPHFPLFIMSMIVTEIILK